MIGRRQILETKWDVGRLLYVGPHEIAAVAQAERAATWGRPYTSTARSVTLCCKG